MTMVSSKGQIKDTNIVLSFGKTDEGKTYYFIKKLENTIIATLNYKEAIDPSVKPMYIGLIDNDGNELISCDKKAIKEVEDFLIVEVANPISASVIEVNNMAKDDPSSTSQLVQASSIIKDKLNNKMEFGGQFIFNDPLSEATVYDKDGHNLVNDEYYSYIAIKDGKLFMSKNTKDAEIVEFSLDKEEAKEVEQDLSNTSLTQGVTSTGIDMPETLFEGQDLNTSFEEVVEGTEDLDALKELNEEENTEINFQDETVIPEIDNMVTMPNEEEKVVEQDEVQEPDIMEEAVAAINNLMTQNNDLISQNNELANENENLNKTKEELEKENQDLKSSITEKDRVIAEKSKIIELQAAKTEIMKEVIQKANQLTTENQIKTKAA